jgi:hypothetical protein
LVSGARHIIQLYFGLILDSLNLTASTTSTTLQSWIRSSTKPVKLGVDLNLTLRTFFKAFF